MITASRDFTLNFLAVVLLSLSTMCLQVLHRLLPHLLTTVSLSWVASVASLPAGVDFEDVTSKSQDGKILLCLPFFKGLEQVSITLVCRASDCPLFSLTFLNIRNWESIVHVIKY